MGKKESKVKWYLLAAAGIMVLAVTATVGFVLVRGSLKQKSYSETIKKADKFVAAENYKDAIIAYENAIEEQPKETEAYVSLAEVYLTQEQPSEAKVTLKKGYVLTKSPKIQYMLTGIEDGSLLVAYGGEEREVKSLIGIKGELGWNTTFLQKIGSFAYQDYQEEYGSFPKIAREDTGQLDVVHQELSAVCRYANTVQDKEIVDTKKGVPDQTSMPEKITLDSIGLMFRNFGGTVTLDKLRSLSSEKVEPIQTDKRTYVELRTGDIIIRVETDKMGNIISGSAWNEILLPKANKDRDKKDQVSGVVLDAVSGEGVAGTVLIFESEVAGGHTDSTATENDGSFHIELEADAYLVTITADGYLTEQFDFKVEKDKNYSGIQYVISPELTAGTARIVLEWGAEPEDLDSYLYGETDSKKNVKVSYQDKVCSDGDKKIAELDVDAMSGYGPETITIFDLSGVYQYKVADFRRTQTMKEKGATVKVYLPGQGQPTVITIDPQAEVKDIWEVFQLDHGELRILNAAPAEDRFTPDYK